MQSLFNAAIISETQLVLGLGLGILIMWLLSSASSRWRRGKGLRRVPNRVRRENEERLWQAQSDRAQGFREMVRAVAQFATVVVIVFLLGLVLGG